jgi:hypothetical protein
MARTSTNVEEKKQELLKQAGEHAEGKLGRDEPAVAGEGATATTANASSANAYQRGPATVRLKQEFMQNREPWYLLDSEELEGVTAEPSNPMIGLLDTKVYAPSDGQIANGAIANITIETIIGTVRNIRIEQSQRDHTLLCRPQSRHYEVDGKRNYINDLELSSKIRAQILRYVSTMLVSAE